MSLLLMIAVATGPAWAQEAETSSESAPTSETDSESSDETPAESAGWEAEATPVEEPAAPAEPAAQEQPEASAAPAQDEALYKSYQDGFLDGQMAASEVAGQYGLHGLLGLGAGCAMGPCGCVVPAAEVLVNPAVPNGVWRAQNSEYQQGYIEGYQRSIQRKRVIYSTVGVGVGTVLGFGAGLAYGAFAL